MRKEKNLVSRMSFLFLLVLTFSCSRSVKSAEELEAYLLEEKNGLVKSSVENGIKVQAVFRPGTLVAFQEMNGKTGLAKSEVEVIRKKYEENIYIMVHISQDGRDLLYQLGDQEAYRKAFHQLAFRMSENVRLISSAMDTISAGDYVFSPMYGMSGATSVMFAFEGKLPDSYEWLDLEWRDPEMGIGDRRFRFERSDLEKIPDLSFETQIIKE